MAKKIMLLPSARSKFVKDDNMKLIYYTLLALSLIMVFLNIYMYSFMYGVKLLLMILVSIVVTVEAEILFYSHDKDINRQDAKVLIKKSYPKITALIYVLLIPIGTPLWLVGIGAILATFLGKLLFGGFAHMIFHTSLVGVIFVTLGWPQLVDSVAFMTSFDNYILTFLFDNSFFNETLSLGGLYDPTALDFTSSLGMLLNNDMYNLGDLFLGITPGVIGSGFVLIIMFLFLVYKKAVNWVLPVVLTVSFFVTAMIIGFANDLDPIFPVYQLLSGSFLFVAIFIATDPITTPVDIRGKIIFGVIAGSVAMIIRNADKYEEGIYFAVLFMMMLTPMINQSFKKKPAKKTVKKAVPKKEVV